MYAMSRTSIILSAGWEGGDVDGGENMEMRHRDSDPALCSLQWPGHSSAAISQHVCFVGHLGRIEKEVGREFPFEQ